MDENASNYDPDAKVADNSTCLYEDINFEKSEMLANLCDNYIIPGYSNFNNKNIALANSASNFSSNPSVSGFEVLKESWKDALMAWQQKCFLDF